VAAIVLWNTVYLQRAVQALRNRGQMIPEALLVHLSPLKWEHINLTGDYHWRRDGGLSRGDIVELFSINVVPFSPNVVTSGALFSANVVLKTADVIGSGDLCSRAATNKTVDH
jgi:hypothetical protein